MNNERNKNILIRVSEKQKSRIEQRAKKCGLTVSEYIRKLALDYEPKGIPSDSFYDFYSKLNELCDKCTDKIYPDTEQKILKIIDAIIERLGA